MLKFYILFGLSLGVSSLVASDQANPNTSFIDDKGQVHATRVIAPPLTLSSESQAKVANPPPSILSSGLTVSQQREKINARQVRDAADCLKIYPAEISDSTIAGVPVKIVTPKKYDPSKDTKVLICIHGGAFRVDTGSLLESIPVASLTGVKVVSILYPLAPENTYPRAVNDCVNVYKALLKHYSPHHIGIYGTSAGAVLTGQVAVKIKSLELPLPSALGIFSGWGDFSVAGDSMSLFGLQGISGSLIPHATMPLSADYVGKTNPKDPLLSPSFSDLRGLPPTLFISSTRDLLLSGTVLFHKTFLHAGIDSKLIVFDGLPHAFWLDPSLPESKEANSFIADFFLKHIE